MSLRGGGAGLAAAALAVAICAAYPVATRAALQSSATPADLVFLRFAVGLLVLAPLAWRVRREFTPGALRAGIPLAAFQGIGMAGLVVAGLQYAPAAHSAALGPGLTSAWVALLGFCFYRQPVDARHAVAVLASFGGVVALLAAGSHAGARDALAGDAMFLAASALGSLYILQLRATGLGPVVGATLVAAYSSLVIVPAWLWQGAERLLRMPVLELAWHALWQGVLIGGVALLCIHFAAQRLGSQRAASAFAFVPALTTLLAWPALSERPGMAETVGIALVTFAVVIGTSNRRRPRVVPA